MWRARGRNCQLRVAFTPTMKYGFTECSRKICLGASKNLVSYSPFRNFSVQSSPASRSSFQKHRLFIQRSRVFFLCKKKPEVRRGLFGSKLKFAHARKFTVKTRYYGCTDEWSCKVYLRLLCVYVSVLYMRHIYIF